MRLYRIIFSAFLFALFGCGEDTTEEKQGDISPSPKKAIVQSTGKLPALNRYRMRPSGGELAEIFAAQVGEIKGQVKIKPKADGEIAPAKTGDKLYGGGYVETAAGGKVELVIREIGNVTLDENGRLLMSPYTRCGAVLAKGGLYLKGAKYARNNNPCFLHTAQTAIMAPGQSAVVEAADNGHVYLGAPTGAVTYVDIDGERKELDGGKEMLHTGGGEAGKAEPFKKLKGEQLEGHYREWRKETVVDTDSVGEVVDLMLKRAEKVAVKLDSGVDRLIELKELNKKLNRERRLLTGADEADSASADGGPPDGGNKEKEAEDIGRSRVITATLVEQAKEMIDLQETGSLQIHRVIALYERASGLSGENAEIKKRVDDIYKKLEAMKEKLPQLFERIKKRSVRIAEPQPEPEAEPQPEPQPEQKPKPQPQPKQNEPAESEKK